MSQAGGDDDTLVRVGSASAMRRMPAIEPPRRRAGGGTAGASRSTMKVLRFRRLLRAVLLSAGPCAVVASSGCGADNVTEMPDKAQCIDLGAPSRYSALTLAPRVDGIAFATRGALNRAPTDSTMPVPTQRLPALGTPCATATDHESCAKRIDELLVAPSDGWTVQRSPCGSEGCGGDLVVDIAVITAGDDVRIAKLDDVVRATAPVETRDEAATLVVLKGYSFDCDMNNVRADRDGWLFKKTSRSCSGSVTEHFYKVSAATGEVAAAGTHVVHDADNGCIEGRRPANLAPTGVAWLSSLAACFSEIAHMEAAAVLAFGVLDTQLRELGAPPELLTRTARAKKDEIAHAAITARLARRFGGMPAAPLVETSAGPDARNARLRLALENAVEGCVREAYGALVAAFQAAHASDAGVRAAFTRIAADEAEHAELSFDIDAWLAPLLTAEEQRQVEAAKADAWLALEVSCDVAAAPEVVAIAGIPSPAEAHALLADLVWAVAQEAA